MPPRNVIKTFAKDGYYHIYNRGVEKRTIFEDLQDYKVFLTYLKTTLQPPQAKKDLKQNVTFKGTSFKGIPKQHKNLYGKVELVAYCLMPNHFHLLVNQKEMRNIETFMRSLSTRYVMYFNKKHNRIGPLFQGIYKAVLIKNEEYLLHLSRYIHLNPLEYVKDLTKAYSSYADYLGLRKTKWVKPDIILSYFTQSKLPELKKVNSYKKFVEALNEDGFEKNITETKEMLGNLILEDL